MKVNLQILPVIEASSAPRIDVCSVAPFMKKSSLLTPSRRVKGVVPLTEPLMGALDGAPVLDLGCQCSYKTCSDTFEKLARISQL